MDDFDIETLLQPTDLSNLDSNYNVSEKLNDLKLKDGQECQGNGDKSKGKRLLGKENDRNLLTNSRDGRAEGQKKSEDLDPYPNLNNSTNKLRRRLSPNKRLAHNVTDEQTSSKVTGCKADTNFKDKANLKGTKTKDTLKSYTSTKIDRGEIKRENLHENIPLDLLAEFTLSLSKKDYELALKHCNSILLLDSTHELANKFSPLLRRAKFELGESSDEEDEGDEKGSDDKNDDNSEDSDDSETDESSTDDLSDSESESESEDDEDLGRAPMFGLSIDAGKDKSRRFDHWRP